MRDSRDFASPSAGIRLELLGGTTLEGPDGRVVRAVLHQPKRLGLLVWLALHGRIGFSRRDELIGVFWPNHDAERGRSALRQAVHFLRQHLGAAAIVGRGDEELGIDPAFVRCDATAFEELIEQGRREEALALYNGPLLPGFFLSETPAFEQWLESSRRRLHELAVAAASELARAAPAGSDHALEWARRAVALSPDDEPGARRLISQLLERGDQAGAVQAYERLAECLRALDLAPSAATEALLDSVRVAAPPSRPHARVGAADSRSSIDEIVRRPGAARARMAPRIAWGTGAALVATLGLAVWAWQASRSSPPATTPDLVAVAPFDALDASLTLWQTGMATVLSANLDGAGPLRTTPASIAIRRWRGPTDRSALVSFARALGAGLGLGGRLVRTGPDSVRLFGTLVDARDNRVLLDTEVNGPEERLADMADTLTVRLLRALGRERPIGAVRSQPIGSTSMSALRPFLRGEQFYRAAQWDSAAHYYRVAVGEDSAFAPAPRRLAAAMSWIGAVFDDSARAYRLMAGALNHGLARRESLVVQAESLFASLEGEARNEAWWRRRSRLYATIGVVQRDYPEDPEALLIAGETMFHYGGHPHTSYARALSTLDRAIALDSAFTPPYVHAIALATRLGDVAGARRYAGHYLSRAGPGVTTFGARVYLLATERSPRRDVIDSLLNVGGAGDLFEAWSALRELGDSAETVVAIMRRLAAGRWRSGPFADSAVRHRFLFQTLLWRGRLAEATRHPAGDPETSVELAMVGALRSADADGRFDQWVTSGAPAARYALPWWAARNDTARIQRFVARRAGDRSEFAEHDRRLAQAYLLLARSDSAAALRALEALPDSLCVACAFPHLARVQLLLATGENARASRHLTQALLWTTQEPPLGSVLWDLYHGVAAERLHDTATALSSYARVERLWRHADPPLAPFVRQAREGTARLSRSGNS